MPDLRARLAELRRRAQVLGGTRRVFGLVWAAQPRLALLVVGLNLAQGIQPAISLWLSKLLIDSVAAADAEAVLRLVVANLIVFLLVSQIGPAMGYSQRQLGDYLAHEVQSRILLKATSLKDVSYFEDPAYYDALRRAQHSDTLRSPISLLTGMTALLRNTVHLVSMLAVLTRFGPLVALAALLLAAPNLYLQLASQYQSFSVARWNIVEARWMRYFGELLTGAREAREVRIFDLGEHFVQRYLAQFEQYIARFGAVRRRYLRLNVACAALTSLGFSLVYGYFGLAALLRWITLGDMTLYSGAALQAHQRIMELVREVGTLYKDVLFVSQLFEFLDAPPSMAVRSSDDARPVPQPMQHGIEFRDVTFTYPGAARPVLERFNLTIRPGECVALVGENGAGKTTIVKLLGRLYDPQRGAVLVDGVDVRDLDLDQWRRQLGAIFQDFARYHLTAGANVGLGRLERLADDAAIERAATRGGATAVVDRLPAGYETVLGRWLGSGDGEKTSNGIAADAGGAELSGGEWQKVALSRAFMRADGGPGDAQLLILDEPTAALDTQAEYDVYARFHDLTAGKATLLISHRFSTVKMADRIVVLENGSIAEEGTHADLMALNGTYADLYEKQASKYR